MVLNSIFDEFQVSTEPVVTEPNAFRGIGFAFGFVNKLVEPLELLDYLLKRFVFGNCVRVVHGSADRANHREEEDSYFSHSLCVVELKTARMMGARPTCVNPISIRMM